MYRYLIIEGKTSIEDQYTVIESLFSDFLDIKEIDKKDHHMIVLYTQETDVSLLEVILNISSDTYKDLRIYKSHHFDTIEEKNIHLQFMLHKLSEIPFNKYTYLDDKIVLKSNLNTLDEQMRRIILRKYANDFMMLDTIKIYLESNLNMVIAAKNLYVHRNTLIQRIDKFYQVTGFDMRNFNDAFLIYHLIK
ncbi:MAG: helix-turn-helix domain-containing protein [Acholeplasmataceae bacterium]|jgi:sugar diacid utilization regulator|nr:helix-turn-helix domain-containing protein [Acholeplasmataceae bacterium]